MYPGPQWLHEDHLALFPGAQKLGRRAPDIHCSCMCGSPGFCGELGKYCKVCTVSTCMVSYSVCTASTSMVRYIRPGRSYLAMGSYSFLQFVSCFAFTSERQKWRIDVHRLRHNGLARRCYFSLRPP